MEKKAKISFINFINALEKTCDFVRNLILFETKEGLKKEKLGVSDIIKDVVVVLGTLIEEQEIRITIDMADNVSVFADKTQVYRVFLNLIKNAVEAFKEKKGEKNIFIAVKRDNDMVRVVVSDTGPGITPQALGRIFEPFFTTKKSKGGSGFGLSIVKGIVEGLGGEITVESQVNKGTTFNLIFPLYSEEGQVIDLGAASSPLAKPRRAAAGSPVMRKERASSPIIVRISRNEARLHDFLEDLWRDVERLCDELAGRKDGIDVTEERQVLIEGLRESIDKYLEDFNKGGFKKIAEYAKDKLEQAINDIERDREPNAHWRLIGVISKVVEAYGGLFKERLERRKRWFRDNKVRVWRRKGNVRMAHGIYEIPEGADRPMLGEGESTFDSAWEMFRGIDKEIDNELKEKQVLTEAEAALCELISFLKSKKQNNEGYVLDADDIEKIKGDFGRVEELMGGFQRRYRADPKKIAQGLLGVVKKIILSGFRHVGTVDSFLDAAVYYLQLRISSIDLIVSRIKEAKLKDARLLVEQRNKDLSDKIKIIISLIKANEPDRAAKYIMGMRNRYDIKNEPDLGYLQGILSRAKKSLDGKNRPDALFDMQMIKEAVFWSDFIRGTIAQFRDELIEIELKEKRILGGQEQYQLLLRVLLSTIKLTGPPQRQAKQLFRAWARVYQAAFIPMNIDNPLKKSQRIPNPTFEAATKYIYILDITKIGILLSKTRQLNKGNFAATRAFLEEVRNKAKRDYLMRLDLPGLVEAIAKDKELSLEQQEALNKCIYPESAISSPASSPVSSWVTAVVYQVPGLKGASSSVELKITEIKNTTFSGFHRCTDLGIDPLGAEILYWPNDQIVIGEVFSRPWRDPENYLYWNGPIIEAHGKVIKGVFSVTATGLPVRDYLM
ncbi:MAG: HAMP domain-containing sensor histidine kinase, partial [Candidatus Omnitrophota bacterium]